jgi:hypothetical protein
MVNFSTGSREVGGKENRRGPFPGSADNV